MLPQYKITAERFVRLFQEVYASSPPTTRDFVLPAWNQFMFGVLDEMAAKFQHIRKPQSLFNVDRVWFYTYDKDTGEISSGVDRPWRAIVAVEHDNKPGAYNFLDNCYKLTHLDILLKTSITYPESERSGRKYTTHLVKQMVGELLSDAPDIDKNEYLLCLGEGWWQKNITWKFFLYDPKALAFRHLTA